MAWPDSQDGWDAVVVALVWRRWPLGIEGAWSYGRGLAQHLVAEGELVFEIDARWSALRRRSAHKPGKTDQLDAFAIALLVRQQSASLPRVLPDDDTAILEVLSMQRDGAMAEATRLRSRSPDSAARSNENAGAFTRRRPARAGSVRSASG